MDKKMKARWTKRLRSGQDLQGMNVLCDYRERKCCLGVLADEAGVPREYRDYSNGTNPNLQGRWEYDFPATETSIAMKSVTEVPDGFYGLTEGHKQTLMGLNDAHRKTFAEIADWIDENL